MKENQFGFISGQSNIEGIHVMKRLMEKYMKRNKDLHMVFVDLLKAYERVSNTIIWDSLLAKKIPLRYIKAMKDMYDGVSTNN